MDRMMVRPLFAILKKQEEKHVEESKSQISQFNSEERVLLVSLTFSSLLQFWVDVR